VYLAHRLLRITALSVVLVLLGFLSVGAALQLSHRGAGTWLSAALIFLGTPWVALAMAGFAPAKQSSLQPFSARWLGIGFAFGLVNFFAWVVPTQALMQALVPKEMFDAFQSTAIFDGLPHWEIALLSAGVVIAAPVCEEFFFRGVLQRGLQVNRGATLAIPVAAVVFSAFHFDPVGFPARVQLGLVFGMLAWRSQSLWAGIGAHAANNLVSVVGFVAGGKSASDDHLEWWAGLAFFAVGNVLLVAIGRWWWRQPAVAADTLSEQPPQSFSAASWPFFAALLVGGSVIAAVDWRGIRLNWVDIAYPAKASGLLDLRNEARHGSVSIDQYRRQRKAVSESQSTNR
jgi:uncharacterized protein